MSASNLSREKLLNLNCQYMVLFSTQADTGNIICFSYRSSHYGTADTGTLYFFLLDSYPLASALWGAAASSFLPPQLCKMYTVHQGASLRSPLHIPYLPPTERDTDHYSPAESVYNNNSTICSDVLQYPSPLHYSLLQHHLTKWGCCTLPTYCTVYTALEAIIRQAWNLVEINTYTDFYGPPLSPALQPRVQNQRGS